VPAQKRGRRDQEGRPYAARQDPARSRQQQPIGGPEGWSTDLAAQNRQFMAQHDDLEFLELCRPKQQGNKLQNALKEEIHNRQEHGTSSRNCEKGRILRDWS
jgi:hypothetical protein